MKKFFIVMTLISMTTLVGCGQNKVYTDAYSKPDNDTVNQIAQDLAKASLNGSMNDVTTLTNKLLANNAILKQILFVGDCHIVEYTYNGKEYSVKVCK